jgi:hypothetical protein
MSEPRILIIDIEWRPTLAYVWRPFKENVNPDQIVEEGGLLCIGAKWLGDTTTYVFTEWDLGHTEMLRSVRGMMNVADAIITFNGDRYDLPKLEGEFLRYNLKLPPKCASIDLYKTVKKLGYFRNSLSYVSRLLELGAKLENEGMLFWRKTMEGDAKTQTRMSKYCAQDVNLTEKLYLRMLPAIRNHPNLRDDGEACPTCGSKNTQKRGFNRSRLFKTQRLQCHNGHWFTGKREKI